MLTVLRKRIFPKNGIARNAKNKNKKPEMPLQEVSLLIENLEINDFLLINHLMKA